jgi:hypothetical protein
MPQPRYNPFGKPISEVKLDDLGVLRSVQEGWYVEYKRELHLFSRQLRYLVLATSWV